MFRALMAPYSEHRRLHLKRAGRQGRNDLRSYAAPTAAQQFLSPMSLMGQKQTCAVQLAMSAKCQKQTFRLERGRRTIPNALSQPQSN